jgi:hypothetical protein
MLIFCALVPFLVSISEAAPQSTRLTQTDAGTIAQDVNEQVDADGTNAADQTDSHKLQITWSPSSIKRMLVPGQTASEIVVLMSDRNGHDVDVVVSPTLSPYIRPFPRRFERVRKGISYSLHLDIAVPPTTAIGSSITGGIQLREDDSILATPLQVTLSVQAASSRNPDPGKIVKDGLISYPVNEIVVTFSPGSSLDTARLFAASIHGTVVGALPEIDTYQVVVSTTTIQGLTNLIQQLRASSPTGVLGLSRNYISTAPLSAPTDLENLKSCSDSGLRTIAYDSVRATGAWQLMRLMNPLVIPRSTTIGLLDTGVQVVIAPTPLGQIFHPEFSAPPVNFGNTPPESRVDADFVAGTTKQGHGTEVAGIVGANNRSDPSLGLDYKCPAMNGIISGVPNISGRYTLEERVGPNATITTQLADTVSATTSGARIVLLEMLNTATTRLTTDQLNTGAACEFSAVNDILDLEINYVRWSNLFKVHSDVLFVLPAGNYDQRLPQLTSASQFADVVSLVGGINRDNTITVGAFDPTQPDTT